MTLTEFCKKDVIQLEQGVKLGRADDLRFNSKTAAVEGMVLFGRPKLFGLMGRQSDVFIPWGEIDTVGTDVVLVNTPLPADETCRHGFLKRLFSTGGVH